MSIVSSYVPKVGDVVKLVLMRRPKQSIFPKMVHEDYGDQVVEARHKFMSRFDVLDQKELLSQIRGEISALEEYVKEYESCGYFDWALSAKSSIRKLKSEEKGVLQAIDATFSQDIFAEVDSNDFYIYYQGKFFH